MPTSRSERRNPSGGFTFVELLIAMSLFAILTGIAVPRAAEAMRIARVDRASRAVAIDLEQALGLAARQRSPVRIEQPSGTRTMQVVDVADETVYSTTRLGDDSSVGISVETLTLEPTAVNVFPNGQTSAALTVTLEFGDHTRTVTMSQAGQIRVF
jgi:prepilin-type N-terminal cleavage/methylation domain-containing protein